MNQIFRNLLILTIFSVFLLNCASSPRFTSENKTIPSRIENSKKNEKTENRFEAETINKIATTKGFLETTIGMASYYGEKFHNRTTYNGEIYDMNGISAAHTFYPMGTKLLVTNLKNGRKVELIVNDKFPKHPIRIIDLSKGAAEFLGFLNEGIVEVQIDVIEWGKGRN